MDFCALSSHWARIQFPTSFCFWLTIVVFVSITSQHMHSVLAHPKRLYYRIRNAHFHDFANYTAFASTKHNSPEQWPVDLCDALDNDSKFIRSWRSIANSWCDPSISVQYGCSLLPAFIQLVISRRQFVCVGVLREQIILWIRYKATVLFF